MHHQWLPDTRHDRAAAAPTEERPRARCGRWDTRSATGRRAGRRRVDLDRAGRHAVRRQRQAQRGFEGLGRAHLTAPTARTVGLPTCSRAAPSPAPSSFLLRRAGRAARALERHFEHERSHLKPRRTRSAGLFSFVYGHVMDFSKLNGLIPAVIQDAATREVLMVGFMNQEALDRTIESGFATFFSRTATSCGRRERPPATACRSNAFSSIATTTRCC